MTPAQPATRRFFAILFLAILTAFDLASAAPAPKPNIVFCIADDWSWPHAGFLGDQVVRTPNIDRLARRGLNLNRAFCAAPSCTPSRAAILTGRYPHQLEEGGNLWGFLPSKFAVFPDLLEKSGYTAGLVGKGWGPGNFRAGGRDRNPAGPAFKNVDDFFDKLPADKPFYFWFGSQDPHRPYERGSGAQSGLDPAKVALPASWPDSDVIRRDILDYYFEVERFDRDVGKILARLAEKGLLTNTIVIVTGDNGLPFPRAKANLYDLGTRVPLVISWPGHIPEGTASDVFVNLADLAPTILQLAGLPVPDAMSARSLLPLLSGQTEPDRTHVFLERERHANVRAGDLSYPSRAIRTADYLYIRNLRPERWPAGDPKMHKAVGPFGDCDNSPSKTAILDQPNSRPFALAFARRAAEELYHLPSDPAQTNNLASDPRHQTQKAELAGRLDNWMRATGDPRLDPNADLWSNYPYFGGPDPMPASAPK